MEYRKLPHGGESISVIGVGTSSVVESSEAEIEATAALAVENGINYFDMAAADFSPFSPIGRAVSGCRKSVYFQVHFGANYLDSNYGWTLNPETIKRSVDRQLKALGTDYIDFGFVHCIDELSDLETAFSGGTIRYMEELKSAGVIHHMGLSTHTPKVAVQMVETGLLDVLMFSINPGYDLSHGEFAFGARDERMELYRLCEARGVGISVMKAFSGGQLLDARTSPFGKALTDYQCIQYALDKPGVLTVLPGVRNRQDLRRILGFFKAKPEERDYSVLGGFSPRDTDGVCVYCNHCKPCPKALDIGLINKYYDLTKAGDVLAKDHYAHLEKKASDCVACGHCDRRCPFHVNQTERMKEIAAYFGA